MKTYDVIATSDVSRQMGAKKKIKKGTILTVVKERWMNGEGWFQFSNGVMAPDVFFTNRNSG